MNTTEIKTTTQQLSEMYGVTHKNLYSPTGGLDGIEYTFDFKFTSKDDYLRFRSLWKAIYAEESARAREARVAHIAYRNAGGFGRRQNLSGDLAQATLHYNRTPAAGDREHRRMLCELRVASKKHSQVCWLAARAGQAGQS
jgi:hypothetical protein